MSEKTNLFQKPKNLQNPQNKNISKPKNFPKKSKVTRNSQTPIKTQLSNKTYMNNNNNNNNNTMIYPNNNYNINNNISININIDMTNERNNSFNLKNKSQVKKAVINNNNLIINTLKKNQNKSNVKKSPFHIRIKTTNLGLKDYKYKPKANQKNKIYQNRLNYYYNISNKNNFNIFSHKFEEKKQENKSNIIDNEHKTFSLNKTPVIEKTNKIYKDLKEKNNKTKKENSKSAKELYIKNNNIKKYINKRNNFSPGNFTKNQSSTPIHLNKLNHSIDNRKLNNNKNKNIINLKQNQINQRNNISSSPFVHNNKKGINSTIDYDKNTKNKMNKNINIIKSPINSKPNTSIYKNNNNRFVMSGTNFRSPMINNKNISKLNKNNNKSNILKEQKEKNGKKDKKENNKVNKGKEIKKDNKEKEKEENTELNKDILEQQNINEKKVEEKKEIKHKKNNINNIEEKKENLIQEIKKEIFENGENINNKDTKEEKEAINSDNKQKEEIKEIKKEEPKEIKKEEPKIQSGINVGSFLDEIFKNSLLSVDPQSEPQLDIPSQTSNIIKKEVTHLDSICKIGYAGPGVKKKNQDNFFIYKNFLNNNSTIYLGVCDGHGLFGHDISGYLVNILPQNLHSDLLKENITSINNDSDYEKISSITSTTFVQTNLNLVNNSQIDCTYSGSTCSSLIFSPEKIISINVGDSRCVLGKFKDNKWIAKNITRDHKPTEEDEKKRIIEKGGRIEAYKDENGEHIGPERVWLKGEDLPGLAMSRSFGDDVAHMIGVTSKPEIMEFKLNEEDKFILLGSDGIFEFIASDEAVNMVKDFYLKNDIEGALNHLYKISSQRWIVEEEVIDDITLIIMFLK